MSRPQAKNGSQKKRSKKAALSPLIRAIREALSSKSKPKPNPERQEISAIRHLFKGRPTLNSKPDDKKVNHIAPLPKSIRFESLEPRVLLSGDVNPAVLAINGEITAPGEQDHFCIYAGTADTRGF